MQCEERSLVESITHVERVIWSAGRASGPPCGRAAVRVDQPASQSTPSRRRMTTGWLFIRRAIASDVTGPPHRRSYSSIHSSAYVAMVSLLFALNEALPRDPCERGLVGFRAMWP
jgi:hypothetical protein